MCSWLRCPHDNVRHWCRHPGWTGSHTPERQKKVTTRTTQLTSAPATAFLEAKNNQLIPAPEVLIGHKTRPDEDTAFLELFYNIEQKKMSKIEQKHVATSGRRQPNPDARKGNKKAKGLDRRPASKSIDPFHTDSSTPGTTHIRVNYTKEEGIG